MADKYWNATLFVVYIKKFKSVLFILLYMYLIEIRCKDVQCM